MASTPGVTVESDGEGNSKVTYTAKADFGEIHKAVEAAQEKINEYVGQKIPTVLPDGKVIAPLDQVVLTSISKRIGEGNRLKGFREEGDQIREILARAKEYGESNGLPLEFWQARYDDYVSKRILLVVSELIEAFEELRSGKGFETYYQDNGKPEGIPSELVDAVIRLFDLFDEFGIDLGIIFQIKSDYNATRGYKHGRKF